MRIDVDGEVHGLLLAESQLLRLEVNRRVGGNVHRGICGSRMLLLDLNQFQASQRFGVVLNKVLAFVLIRCLGLEILNHLDPFIISQILEILIPHLESTVALAGNSRYFIGQTLILLVVNLLLDGVLMDDLVLLGFVLVWMLPHHLSHELVTHNLGVALFRLSPIF